jgi:hypothetical protein
MFMRHGLGHSKTKKNKLSQFPLFIATSRIRVLNGQQFYLKTHTQKRMFVFAFENVLSSLKIKISVIFAFL